MSLNWPNSDSFRALKDRQGDYVNLRFRCENFRWIILCCGYVSQQNKYALLTERKVRMLCSERRIIYFGYFQEVRWDPTVKKIAENWRKPWTICTGCDIFASLFSSRVINEEHVITFPSKRQAKTECRKQTSRPTTFLPADVENY